MKRLQWVTCPKAWQSAVFRANVGLDDTPEAAKIKICGLGFFELYINGARVGRDYFVPAWSDYEKRDLSTLIYPINGEFTYRVYYLVYDVARYLKKGENVIEALLGNGWYRQNKRNAEGNLWYGDELKLAFRLTAACGGKEMTVESGAATVCREGCIVENNIYFGETHDYARNIPLPRRDDGEAAGVVWEWMPAQKTNAPEAIFAKQDCPPDRVIRSLKPALLHDCGDRKIYDAGENISGWARVVSAGETVTVRYAENVRNGALDFASAGGEGQIQSDTFLNAPPGTALHPRFTWHAFRYFEIAGRTGDVIVDVVHADVEVRAKYEGANEVHRWLFDAFIRTQLVNMHAGVPSDCPHRERLGYTGDGQLVCDTAMTLLDCRRFYKKWIQDILDCQDRRTGHIRHTAPFYGGGGGPGGWGGAVVIVPYMYYKHYGDKVLLKKCYKPMLRWLACMRGFAEGGLIVREIGGGWCLGDWCTPGKVLLPEPFVNTYYYVKCMRYIQETADILGEDADFAAEIDSSLSALTQNYYDEQTGSFCGGVQGADAFGLDLGLGGARTLDSLIAKYSSATGLDTGIFGTDVLCKVLYDNGRHDLVLRLLSLTGYPSFGHMKAQGATTLWETWNGDASHNHPMFGAAAKYLLGKDLDKLKHF
ncbi:MAG: family 78 glycoside hydrolase catalytic domain [Firmicutes bacterium]|nr:family 78 glycoside hydrolase catalytic domain [Bacillota bacterium]